MSATFEMNVGAMDRVRREILAPAAEATAEIVRAEIVSVVLNAPPRTGRVRSTKGVRYRSSAPGEPPASPTGLYPRSWVTTPAQVVDDTAVATAESNLRVGRRGEALGRILESGGRVGRRRLAPRPHIVKALVQARPKIREALRRMGKR